jgi:hypothetical protein
VCPDRLVDVGTGSVGGTMSSVPLVLGVSVCCAGPGAGPPSGDFPEELIASATDSPSTAGRATAAAMSALRRRSGRNAPPRPPRPPTGL